ncbi:hypothetical protein GGTG_08121 [Gaeumannomyces tritici R3-111a-1]|uniref:Mmc1 C-terminal domain-containing protein n=1 Tax=Gaeumannomyces tritici (strain R3-111a-1) TaxID=644352 RepID=J3P3N4_GAET3|nr:hypothetical protein GGTG_08121 [Gaeumannomyces tritici R3-111a-1]EJT74278.1 hypothetical protein GGTG_08121 [Gaeumannomyces tritici R3-111a-1]
MPPRLALTGAARSLRRQAGASVPSVCLFCSLAPRRPSPRAGVWPRQRRPPSRPLTTTPPRAEPATTTASPQPTTTENPRRKLEDALLQLQRHAPGYVNLPRTQLALQGLRQDAGRESVRLAMLGLGGGGGGGGGTARGLLQAVLADPLSPEQEWERRLAGHDDSRPLLIRIRPEPQAHEEQPVSSFVSPTAPAESPALDELSVSSPTLNGHGIEILLTGNIGPMGLGQGSGAVAAALEEAVLTPAIDMPTSNTGGATQMATPVHKALVVGHGILGATQVSAMPVSDSTDTIAAAVDLKGVTDDDAAGYPFVRVDVEGGKHAIALFRQDVANAIKYETLWFQSNINRVKDWLLAGALSSDGGAAATKPAVRQLVASVLRGALAAVRAGEARGASAAVDRRAAATDADAALSRWAEAAHAELEGQLDLAFAGHRWRKLGWWKLFWRVDDVGMISADMIAQQFLPAAERDLIYLAGRISGAGLAAGKAPEYPAPAAVPAAADTTTPAEEPATAADVAAPASTLWPTHIPHTRRYLLNKSVPALQALAQKLVLQALSTSTLTTSLGVLAYMSALGGAYEAGAVAALGTVWSLRRMQRSWEAARAYWEGQVREEGRKAVRAVEASVEEVLLRTAAEDGADHGGDAARELARARELVGRAEEALAELK